MFDEFIYRYRFVVGGLLLIMIVTGLGLLAWESFLRNNENNENRIVAELKNQNELLRKELSLIASRQIAGAESRQTTGASIEKNGLVNLNLADEAQLDSLPGIGPAKAKDIISYRENNGGFNTIEELKEVKWIGEKSFENLKDLVTVE